jgi:hypothetical protein
MENDLDFSAAMTPPQSQPKPEPDFSAAMAPKKKGRPRTKPAPIYKYSINNKEPNRYNGNNPDIVNNLESLDNSKLKDKLTKQELIFLELLFNSPRKAWKERITIDKAMLAAGYGGFSQTTRYIIAGKIIRKYERGAAGAAEIFQAINFGMVKVAQGIADKAENAQSEAVSLNALALAARCQGMTEPSEAGRSTGVQIIINTGPAPAQEQPQGPPALVINADGSPATQAIPTRPLQITR